MIRAIETHYKGYRFRSRLEARWAVYFDSIGLDWSYELEGFELPSGRYLPDFYLPQVRSWAEVKPADLNLVEIKKVTELVMSTEKDCILLVGVPSPRPYEVVCKDSGGWQDTDVYLTDCVISMYHGYPINESRFYTSTGGAFGEQDFGPAGIFDDVGKAVSAARSARFEFNR